MSLSNITTHFKDYASLYNLLYRIAILPLIGIIFYSAIAFNDGRYNSKVEAKELITQNSAEHYMISSKLDTVILQSAKIEARFEAVEKRVERLEDFYFSKKTTSAIPANTPAKTF